SRVASVSLRLHAVATTPAEPLGEPVALYPSDGSLPCFCGRSASALVLSRPAQRSMVTACKLAESLNDPLHRRRRRSRHLLRRYNCYRLTRCRVGLSPSGKPRLLTAHAENPLNALYKNPSPPLP